MPRHMSRWLRSLSRNISPPIASHRPGLLPDLGRMEDGHRDLLPADRVHLLADDRVDLVDDPLPERQVDVDPRGELADEPGPDHELVTDRLSVGWVLPQRRDQRA